MNKQLLSIVCLAVTLSASAHEGWPANYGGVMLQGFWWDSYAESQWTALTNRADELSTYFDLIWIPNAGTTSTAKYDIDHGETIRQSMGYDPCYWLEYNSCFGTEQELLEMIDTYRLKGTGIIEDVVINHKNGVSGWCDFPNEQAEGRKTGATYSLTWDNTYYSGICSNDEANSNEGSGVAGKITGNEDTGTNFDGYRDLDHTNELVQQNIMTYQDYMLKEIGFAGFRLDMVLGYAPEYTKIYNEHSEPKFSVGECWADKGTVTDWIRRTGYSSAAFDFPLKYAINGFAGGNWDALSDKSFTADPSLNRYSVTFADNHDTFRDGSKLPGSWSAATAFILTMPGTPCVFFKHYEVDKTNIQQMILARKACGVHNQSAILKQEKYYNGYIIETQGTYGRLYLQLGDATGLGTPDGYELVAASTNEVPYRMYKNENVPELLPYYANIYNEQELSVFFETSASKVTIWAWNSTDNFTGGNWDTKPEMKWVGKAANNKNIYKWIYTGDKSGAPTNVIFLPDGGSQTSELAFVNHGFYLDEEQGKYSSTITATHEGDYTVYFDASNTNWSNIYAYAWQGGTGVWDVAWPGKLMTKVGDGLYAITLDGKYEMVIFNSGDGQQTQNFQVFQGNVYNESYNTRHTRYELADGIAIAQSMNGSYETFYYSRNYNGNWQALYVPFAIPYNVWGDDFVIAEPTSCDGDEMKIRKLSVGEETSPNGIYFIKANEAGDKRLVLSDVTVEKPAEETTLEVSGYTFHGTSVGVTRGEWDAAWYAMGNSGALAPTNATNLEGDQILLKAQRWYLEAPAGAPAKLRLSDDEEEGIETINEDPAVGTICYDLQGRRVGYGKSGFVIVNGRIVRGIKK